jgi:hypothetical protein
MKEVIFSHYDGLGDYFVCNGLVNVLSDTVDLLHLPVPECFLETIECLYADNPKVKLFCSSAHPQSESFQKYAEENKIKTIIDNCWKHNHNRPTFQTNLYNWCNVDYSARYSNCYTPNTESSKHFFKKYIKSKPYTIVHDTCSLGQLDIKITTNYPIFKIHYGLTNNLLDYVEIIQQAEEIHVVDSSVYHLIDNMNINAKLIYHDIRNSPDVRITISNKWNSVFYPEQKIVNE